MTRQEQNTIKKKREKEYKGKTAKEDYIKSTSKDQRLKALWNHSQNQRPLSGYPYIRYIYIYYLYL